MISVSTRRAAHTKCDRGGWGKSPTGVQTIIESFVEKVIAGGYDDERIPSLKNCRHNLPATAGTIISARHRGTGGKHETFCHIYHSLSGKALTDEYMDFAVIKQFAHGGMSSGGVDNTWWMEEGIPLLKNRLAGL